MYMFVLLSNIYQFDTEEFYSHNLYNTCVLCRTSNMNKMYTTQIVKWVYLLNELIDGGLCQQCLADLLLYVSHFIMNRSFVTKISSRDKVGLKWVWSFTSAPFPLLWVPLKSELNQVGAGISARLYILRHNIK